MPVLGAIIGRRCVPRSHTGPAVPRTTAQHRHIRSHPTRTTWATTMIPCVHITRPPRCVKRWPGLSIHLRYLGPSSMPTAHQHADTPSSTNTVHTTHGRVESLDVAWTVEIPRRASRSPPSILRNGTACDLTRGNDFTSRGGHSLGVRRMEDRGGSILVNHQGEFHGMKYPPVCDPHSVYGPGGPPIHIHPEPATGPGVNVCHSMCPFPQIGVPCI